MSKTDTSTATVSRRTALAGTLLATAAPWSARAEKVRPADPERQVTTPRMAVVRSRDGLVQGYERGGVFIFKGIPYGRDTGGAARFLPPRPPAPWPGVRRTWTYGPVCPQPVRDRSNPVVAFFCDWDDGYPSEDCLCLNVWSGSLEPAARRPVMVWLHGGGFTAGSSQELPSYDGENLARRGAVVVSVNHRLGPLGYLDLSQIGGASYASSGNVGQLDLVLALEWVRDNAAQFGGDPQRVTIFGQSGGGAKVSALMAMPAARGLFHRAVVMSGSYAFATHPGASRAAAASLCDALGIPHEVSALQKVEVARLVAASAALRRAAAPGADGHVAWGPVIDGRVLPEGWERRAPAQSARIPLMVGSTRDEFRAGLSSVAEADLPRHVPAPARAHAAAIIGAIRRAYPALSSSDVAAVIGGLSWRVRALAQLRQQHALGGAPVYSYWYFWPSPLLDGAIGVPHTADLAAAFDNVRRCDQLTGNVPEAHQVAERMSRALIAFAASGNPSLPELSWPAYDPRRGATMMFDVTSQAVDDPLGEAVRLMTPA